jgi:hypothetical protein
MAYTGRGNTGNRDGHGWAIAGAFAGQAAIIVGIGALLAGADTTGAVTQASAVPAIAVPAPAISAVPDIQPLIDFPYRVTMNGQSAAAGFPDSSPVHSFMVKPGQDLTITLDVTIPSAQSVTDVSVSLIGATSDTGGPDIQPSANDTVQPLTPGTHVFVLSWPGSASELKPGTQWPLYMSVAGPGWRESDPIANVTVAS